MLDVVFACDFEDSDSPIHFGFLADGEAVRVHKCEVDALEGRVQGLFIVGVAFDDCNAGEGGEFFGRGRRGRPG